MNKGIKISYIDLKKIVQKAIKKVKNESYCNIMKYAYKNQKNREVIRNHSTRKRKSKEYKI